MSSVQNGAGQFSQQKSDIANKKHTDLSDTEKIYLLKQEIDSLRGQINDKEHDHYGWKEESVATTEEAAITSSSTPVPYQSSSSSSTVSMSSFQSNGGAGLRMPLLTFFLVGAVVATLWVVRRSRSRSNNNNSNSNGTTPQRRRSSSLWSSMRSFQPLATMESASEALQFELREHSTTSFSSENPSISITSREEDAANNNNNAGNASYKAPDASQVQFV
ncbi:MAG: hypothetical protein SGILL_005282 [Bacillariaceae sp.]